MKKQQIFTIFSLMLAFQLTAQTMVPVVFIVSDFTTNKNINGAQVSVRQGGWATKSTGVDGKVSFNDIPVGAINFIITKDGYQLYEGEANVSIEVKSNNFRIPLTIIPTTKDKILVTGEVADKDGRDVEGAWVEVKAANIIQNGLTDKSGNYSIEISINSGYTVNNLAIEAKKGDCKVKQNIDIPRGNVVYKDFTLDCEGEADKQGGTQPNEKTIPPKTKPIVNLGTQTIDNIRLVIIRFEQVGSKATFHYTLENLSEAKSVREWHVHPNFSSLIDQKGNSYECQRHVIGNSDARLNLIYQNPVDCYLEFNVGAVQVSKAAYLKIGAYNNPGTFEFTNIPVK